MICVLYFTFVSFTIIISLSYSLHLTSIQVNMINNLIRSNTLNKEQRSVLNKLMYTFYEKWAIKKAINFKYLHRFKCKNIAIEDLILSSKFGLYKAAENYNANSSFPYYSEMHIKNELLKTLTKHYSFSRVPRELRRKNKMNFTSHQIENYRNLLHPQLISYSEQWKFDELSKNTEDVVHNFIKKEEKNEKIKNIWNIVNNFEPLSKKIFYLRYDGNLTIIRSNKEVAKLLGYTPHYVRMVLKKSMQIIQKALSI